MTRSPAVRLRRGVRMTPVEDGVILVCPRGRYVRLNGSAAVILRALLDNDDAGVVAAVRETFDVPERVVRADIAEVAAQLRARRLVR